MGRGRHLHDGQMIHSSLLSSESTAEYTPKASLRHFTKSGSKSWSDFRRRPEDSVFLPSFIELDIDDYLDQLKESLERPPASVSDLPRLFVSLLPTSMCVLIMPKSYSS